MNYPFLTKTRVVWLSLSLLTLSLGNAPAAMAGKTSAGGASGVTTSGSVPLPIGGSPITAETTTSNSANVSLDPQTGSLQLTPEAQAALNQTAQQVLQQLEASSPGLTAALANSEGIAPDRQIRSLALAIRGVNENNPVAKATLREAAIDARDQGISRFRWAELYIEQEVLELTAPLVDVNSDGTYAMTAVYTPLEESEPSAIALQGNLDDLGNAAAFLVITAGSGIDPEAVTPFVNLATAGVAYEQVLALMVSVGDVVADSAAGEDIDPNQLNQAIFAYRAIVNSVDTATINNLRDNSGFIALNNYLQSLRNAIET